MNVFITGVLGEKKVVCGKSQSRKSAGPRARFWIKWWPVFGHLEDFVTGVVEIFKNLAFSSVNECQSLI